MGEERFSGGLWMQGDTGDYLPVMPIQEINEITDAEMQISENEPVYRIKTELDFTVTVKINNRYTRHLRKVLTPSWWRRPIRWKMRERAWKLRGKGVGTW